LFFLCIALASLVLIGTGCSDNEAPASKSLEKLKPKPTPVVEYVVMKTIPHDSNNFTEGFLFHNGQLYESTGSPDHLNNTKSEYGVTDTTTGAFTSLASLPAPTFGEGITILNNKVYQLTYKSRVGHIYDAETNQKLGHFTIPSTEGWGFTHNNEHLIMSNGSHKLTYLDTNNLMTVKTKTIFDKGKPVLYLNELEYVEPYIYANVFMTNTVVVINEKNGKVVAKINLDRIKQEELAQNPSALETNGIAYNPSTGLFYVTGKMWRKTYVLQLDEF
jgi:glutamine cyclotransferase